MLDLLLFLFFLYLLFLGTHRGFVEILIKLTGIGAGVFLSLRFAPYISFFLSKYFHPDKLVLNLLSFLIIFIPIISLTVFINIYVQKHIRKKKFFSVADKVSGGFIATVFFIVFIFLLISESKHSYLLQEILKSSEIISFFNKLFF